MKPDNSSNIFMLREYSQLHVPHSRDYRHWMVKSVRTHDQRCHLKLLDCEKLRIKYWKRSFSQLCYPQSPWKKTPNWNCKVQIIFFPWQGVTWMTAELCFHRTGQRATINMVNTMALLLKLCKWCHPHRMAVATTLSWNGLFTFLMLWKRKEKEIQLLNNKSDINKCSLRNWT